MNNDLAIRKKSIKAVDGGNLTFNFDSLKPCDIWVYFFCLETREFFSEITTNIYGEMSKEKVDVSVPGKNLIY
jgi:hypothetical protein